MALDRWVALVILGICLAYGYTAWFMMDSTLPPIMKRLAVWPSSFPKVLSIAGIFLSLIVLLGIEKGEVKLGSIDYFDRWICNSGGTPLGCDDFSFSYRDGRDLVSGPRGAWHLPTSIAIFYGDLINA